MVELDKNIRILVVDDFETMRKLLIKNLNQMGYHNIIQAAHGQEALRILDTNTVQMVLTDWNMPVMDGLALLTSIRQHPALNALPVLMITAEIARHQVAEALAAGVSGFLVKPFTVGGLQERFDKIINDLQKGKVIGAPRFTEEAPEMALASAAPVPASIPIKPAPVRVAEVKAAPDENAPATLMIVDDTVDNIDVLVGLLQGEYKLQTAKSGETALKLLEKVPNLPDLILLDVMMPEMDGFEVCRRLKEDPRTVDIPILFLSATTDKDNIVKGLTLGAVDYVTKPANPTVLKMRIQTHLTRTRALNEVKQQNAVLLDNLRLREEVENMTRHDLKNPIGGIMNFTDLLLSDQSLSEEQIDIISTIGDSARMVLNMVNLSLDLAKIEQGIYQLQASPLDLAAILRRSFNDKIAEIKAKSLTIVHKTKDKMDTPAEHLIFPALGDELLCYSSFGNLVKNAVEAAPLNSQILVYYAEDGAGFATVTIANKGVVPTSIRDNFFDKFTTAEKRGGTGIGTYSAKLLTEVQNGRIQMQTSDEKGETTITVALPKS